jgi:hypothetical protein
MTETKKSGGQSVGATTGEMLDDKIALAGTEVPILSVGQVVNVEAEVAQIEKNIELFNRVKQLALRLTRAEDWVDMGGPYLMDRGTENIGIAFGVDISGVRLVQEWAEDPKGRYYAYVATGKARAKRLDREVEDVGVCSQRDKFFGMAGGVPKLIEDVDAANIRRKAVTNLYNRLIKRVVGLMGVTMDDLKAAGIDTGKIAKVDYKEGAGRTKAALSPELNAKAQKIRTICLLMAEGNPEGARKFLSDFSAFKVREKDASGKEVEKTVAATDISRLTSEKWINKTLGNAEAAYAKAFPGLELPAPTPAGEEA